jgi:hypothetical protein
VTFLVEYANGAREEVPRCFLFETKSKETGEWTKRWLVERKNGERATLLTEEISRLQFRPEGLPEAWAPRAP